MEGPRLVTTTGMDAELHALARATRGFMPDDEGLALYEAALEGARIGPVVEIGSYCGKSTLYVAAAARERGQIVYSIDHHRGNEENQPGQQFHDPDLVDAAGRVDTLPAFRATIEKAQLQDVVVAIVGLSEVVARPWTTQLGFLFIDGGHSSAAAHGDYDAWSRHLQRDGVLAIHDVFPDPADGGRPPFEIYQRAVDNGYREIAACGSLRVLRKT